ncbi:MAG TPA: ATP-binding protein, partial [Planctomycetota bacterium]|nr:ATP-binding protein [Planctomycetota bacterium]
PVQAFSDEAVTPAEKRPALLVARDGRERVVEGTVSSFPPAGAIGPGTVLALRDVTERRRADLALIESERVAYEWLAEIESFYATAPVGLGSLDTSLRYVRVNDRLAEIYGVRPEELLQRSLGETMPEMAAELEPILRRVLTTGEPAENREVRRRGPGESHPRIYLESYFPLRGTGDEIVGVNAVVQDVTELKEAEESLREANQRKSEFLAVLAHELRNPLTAITYGLYALRLEKENPERVIETTSQLEKQAQKMKQILEDLFDLERIVRGKFKLDREIVDFGEIVRASIDSLREDARQKEIALEEDVAANLRVLGDPVRLDQIVTNLVTNAIKFTDVGGHVWVHVTGEADHVLLRVRDTGIGMSPEFLPYAFEPFRQEDVRRREGAHAGLGLGLRLVKSLTALHGGSVSCSSEGRGRGSEFVVRLPLCRRQVEVEGAGPTIERPGGRTARRVLLVEDSRELAEEFTRVLESYGHSVRVSHDAESALASFEDEPPEAALIDIGLPGMNGYEICRELRRNPLFADTLIVAQTGWGQDRHREMAWFAGFNEHLVKPLKPAELEAVFAKAGPRALSV